jgi:hypothetical protein
MLVELFTMQKIEYKSSFRIQEENDRFFLVA